MIHVQPSYESLQSSWFAGEPLSETEEQRRLELASQDPLFSAECAALAELKRRLEVSEPTAPDIALINRVLSHPDVSPPLPRLRLVRHEESAPPTPVRARLGTARAWPLALAAVAVLAAGGALAWLRQAGPQPVATLPGEKPVAALVASPARAELVFASGQLGGGRAPPLGGRPLEPGAVIETAAGQACLTIDPSVDICIGAWSEVMLSSLREGQLELEVKRGLALATLTHRAPGQTFSLLSHGVKATAIGTTFGIDARGPSPEVVVLEGTVDVKPGAQAASEFVHGHSRWRLASGVRPAQSAIGRAEEAALWALLAPRELWRHSEVGILDLRSTASGLTAAIDESHRFALPLSTFLPAGKHQVKVRNAAGAEASYAIEIDAGAHKALDIGDLSENKAAGVRERPPSAPLAKIASPSPSSLLERARSELRSGNVSAALSGYAELRRAFPGSAEAWTVLPTMGRLELEQRKAPGRALGFFETYLGRPGPLRQEALSGKISALRALGRTSEERLAIEQFVNQYPNSLETSALRRRLHRLGAP